MRVLVACECSGIIRNAFVSAGHDAFSCDLKPSETERPDGWDGHYQGDIFELLEDENYEFDLVIAHPPCTRLANSGVLRLYKGGKKKNGIDWDKWVEMLEAAYFFKKLMQKTEHIKHRAIENPIMHGHAKKIIPIGKADQIVQPYRFGEDASKATCLWLKNLPPLKKTIYFPPRLVNGKPRWGNQTDSGQNKLPPSATRAADRAVTYQGIADAMAEQWGSL